MSKTSKSELPRLLDDDELGEQAYRLDILSRWPSLRVLDFLFTEGRSTTGEIARGVNMDMGEIRERLRHSQKLESSKKLLKTARVTGFRRATDSGFQLKIETVSNSS